MVDRLTLSNRPENAKTLQEFVRAWGRQRGWNRTRLKLLEKAAGKIFLFLLQQGYPAGQPGSVTVGLEEREVRTRLVFEDDGQPYRLETLDAFSQLPGERPSGINLGWLKDYLDSLVYCRTPEQKNHLVLFLTF